MPYKSEAQRKYFNSPEGKKKIGPEEVEHWNEVSKGMKLPKKVEEDKEMNVLDKAIKNCDAGRGYSQSLSEAKGLVTRSKNLTTQLNRLYADIEELRKAIKSDNSLQIAQYNEIEKYINEAYNYIGNNTEIH